MLGPHVQRLLPARVASGRQFGQLKRQLLLAYQRDWSGTHSRIVCFAEKLRRRYPDCRRYRFYHALVGSTPSEAQDRDDFPNNEIAAFVASL